MSVTINVDMGEVSAMLRELKADINAAVRPAAQAAAQVLYDEVKRNVAAIGRKTGNLDRAIYQVFSRSNSDEHKSVYHVSWNAAKAPHGHLVEYGHMQRYAVFLGKDGKWRTNKKKPLPTPRQVGARPFVRPAMSKFDEAMEAAKAELFKHIEAGT